MGKEWEESVQGERGCRVKRKGGGGQRGKGGQRGVQQTERCMDTYTIMFVFVTVNNVFLLCVTLLCS